MPTFALQLSVYLWFLMRHLTLDHEFRAQGLRLKPSGLSSQLFLAYNNPSLKNTEKKNEWMVTIYVSFLMSFLDK